MERLAAPASLSVASGQNRGALGKPKPRSSVIRQIKRRSVRQPKQPCATPNRKVRTDLKSNLPNGVLPTHCKWRSQADLSKEVAKICDGSHQRSSLRGPSLHCRAGSEHSATRFRKARGASISIPNGL